MNYFALSIEDPLINAKFKEHRYDQFGLPFFLLVAFESFMSGFRILITRAGAGDWDFGSGSNDLVPHEDSRTVYDLISLGLSILIIGVYLLSKYKIAKLHDAICFLMLFNTCANNFLYMPFNPLRPREYVFWSCILLFRCSIIQVIFNINGSYDLIYSTMFPLTAICVHAFNMVDVSNLVYMALPIIICVVGVSMFNYMISREHRALFLLEKFSLKTQQEQMEIINLLPGGVMIVDPRNNDILFQNESIEDFGISMDRTKVVTQKFKQVATSVLSRTKADAVRLYENPDENPDQENEPEQFETFMFFLEKAKVKDGIMIQRVDGDELTLAIRTQKFHYNQRDALLVYMQNTTSAFKLQEMEAQDRLTTMYSANVSHEMRTPLSTSINFTDLLLSQEKDNTKRKHLEIIKFSSILMLNNVNDTLDHAQIQRGTFQQKPVRCDVKQTVHEVVKVVEMQAASKNIDVKMNLPKKTVIADKQRVQQVTMNLLSNAVKFTQDGVIEINAWTKDPPQLVQVGQSNAQNHGRLYISVKDSGCGINKADQYKIFRDFCTLKSNAHLNPNGVGLGLSICKKITNLLGGDI